jgi:hypothetical protein
MRCKHETLVPLKDGDTIEERLARIFSAMDHYQLCTGCGRIGYRRRSRRAPFAWLPREVLASVYQRARKHPNNLDLLYPSNRRRITMSVRRASSCCRSNRFGQLTAG